MTGIDCFFDTGIILDLFAADSAKSDAAEALLEQSGIISVQVLSEFTAVGLRTLNFSHADLKEAVSVVRAICPVVPLTIEAYDRSVEVARRYRLSMRDSLIIASALLAGCKTLYSGHLEDQSLIDKTLRIVDPFVSA